MSSSSSSTLPHSLQRDVPIKVRSFEGGSEGVIEDGFEGMIGGVSEGVIEGVTEEAFERNLGLVVDEVLRGASSGISRTAPQALQVDLGICINPHLWHLTL
jgi:hypothetical protein